MLPFMGLLFFFFYIFSLIGMSFYAGKIIFDGNTPIIISNYENVKYHTRRADDFSYPAGTPYIVDANGNNVTIGTPVREGFDRLG